LAEERADELLAVAVAVDVGGVKERHAGVGGRVQHAAGGVIADVAPVAAELPASLTDDADGAPGPAQNRCLHGAQASTRGGASGGWPRVAVTGAFEMARSGSMEPELRRVERSCHAPARVLPEEHARQSR